MGSCKGEGRYVFLKCVSFTVGFMNEWSVASVPWFLEEMKPLLDTSNAFTVHWYLSLIHI